MLATILMLHGAIADDEVAKYPNATIRIIVPFPAGGTADALPRIVADKLRERWKQPVIIVNQPGAGGNIGAETVAHAEPDGYTLLASPPGPIAINEALYQHLPFRPSDLEPVTVLGSVANVLDVRPDFPVRTARAFIAYVKSNPGKVTFASQGVGSTSHLAGVLFEKLTSSTMVHVPYGGSAPALQDIMGGQVDSFFDNLASSQPLYKADKLLILAVGSSTRISSLPDVPTVAEAGVAGFESSTWFAVTAPPKTPAALIERINRAMAEILMLPDVRSRLSELGVQAVGGSVADTVKFVAGERVRWGNLIRDENIQTK